MALMVGLGVCLMGAGAAGKLFKEGRVAEKEGRYGAAYLLYSQAYALHPGNGEYKARADAVRRQGIMQLDVKPKEMDGGLEAEATLPGIEAEDLKDELMPAPVLVGTTDRHSFKLNGPVRELWEKVLKPYALEAVFDADLTEGKPIRFEMENADWRTAVRALETVTGTFIVPLGDRLGIVVKETVQKRSEMERHMTATVHLPGTLTPQELQEAVQAVRSVFDIQKFGVDSARGLVMLKDRASRVKPAAELFRQLMEHRAQVMLEIDIVNLGATSSLRFGMQLPTSFPIVNLSRAWGNSPTVPAGIGNILTFGSGKWIFGLGLSGAELFASMTEGEGSIVARSRVLAVNGQAASMHVGDRYPLQTQSFLATAGTGDYRPPPQIQFEDLGLVLKATPYVHSSEEMTLDVEVEFKLLTGTSLNGIPVISNRKLQSRVRMKFGETAVVAGLTGGASRRSMSGLPGLIALPPFRTNDRSEESADLLVTIRPGLTALPPSESVVRTIWAGTETRPLTPLN
ncbi:MAG: hypothetical protein C0504_05575 [Candidatus Solibacter sp.]|nr:hypothetical protein [Candidatus Solibacter sp.]